MNLSDAIGGYFELELSAGNSYHNSAVALNTGRNALEYILRVLRLRKVYLPYYTCHVLQQPLLRLEMDIKYYGIDKNFEPVFDYNQLKDDEAFIYTNYYGLKQDFIAQLRGWVPNLIIDNAQAFYSKPLPGVSTFYSPRKFFGVPDGGYAYATGEGSVGQLPLDQSSHRFDHLLRRLENGAEDGYPSYVSSDKALDGQPMRAMSVLTQRILGSIDYNRVAETRRANYLYIEEKIGYKNQLNLSLSEDAVPMVYPFMIEEGAKLRSKLISNRIYVAQYWPEVLYLRPPESIEHQLAAHLLALPIDQRIAQAQLTPLINLLTNAY